MRFHDVDAVFQIDQIDRRRQIGLAFVVLGGDQQGAQFLGKFSKHDFLQSVLQRAVSVRLWEPALPVDGMKLRREE
jgi:hypothetical protein